MQNIPSWLIFIGLTALLMLSYGLGWRSYSLDPRSRGSARGDSADAGHLVSSSLGFVSLLLSFTLLLSLDRYESRRHLVLGEAAAISSTWLRDQLLAEPFRGRLDRLLRIYARERREQTSDGMSPAALDAAVARTEALQQQIWAETSAGLKQPGATALAEPILQSTNQMFDQTVQWRAELDAQVPPPVLWIVFVIALIAAAITGYGFGPGGRPHPIASGGLFVSIALAITLIFELDEPRTGLIRVPQWPMAHVADLLQHAPTLAPAH